MDTTLSSIVEQLTEAQDKIVAEIARLDELIAARAVHVSESERIDRALEALRQVRPAPPMPEPTAVVVVEANGANGHTNGTEKPKKKRAVGPALMMPEVEYDGTLGRVVRLLERKKKPLAASTIHASVATAGTHEASTYGVLKRAIERGIVRRLGEQGSYRFELARQ